jgi:hypothetical protein
VVGVVGVVKGRTSASPSKKTSLDIAECGKQSRPVVVVNRFAVGVEDMWSSAVAAGFIYMRLRTCIRNQWIQALMSERVC